jgi:hypothetical protein
VHSAKAFAIGHNIVLPDEVASYDVARLEVRMTRLDYCRQRRSAIMHMPSRTVRSKTPLFRTDCMADVGAEPIRSRKHEESPPPSRRDRPGAVPPAMKICAGASSVDSNYSMAIVTTSSECSVSANSRDSRRH